MEMPVIVFPVEVCQPEADPDSRSVIRCYPLNTAGLTARYTSTFKFLNQLQH